jgi:hypothetical protein
MQHGPAASSGSNPKAPGSAGGYLLSNIPSKEAMLRIAEDYEHLAEWAEERAKRSA